jgi:hypothetical protein
MLDMTLVGFKRVELASWTFINKTGTEFWHSANIGLSNRFELTIAGFWGYSKPEVNNRSEFSFTGGLRYVLSFDKSMKNGFARSGRKIM